MDGGEALRAYATAMAMYPHETHKELFYEAGGRALNLGLDAPQVIQQLKTALKKKTFAEVSSMVYPVIDRKQATKEEMESALARLTTERQKK